MNMDNMGNSGMGMNNLGMGISNMGMGMGIYVLVFALLAAY